MLEIIENESQIVNLYKDGSHAPYTKLPKENFGYLGVLLSRKIDGKIQCHVCGNWYHTLQSHVSAKHKMFKTLKDYKYNFGFSALFPLCSFKVSLGHSKTAKKQRKRTRKLMKKIFHLSQTKKARLKNSRSQIERAKTASFLNERDICEDQIKRRIAVIAEKFKRFPTVEEIKKCDPPIIQLIRNRYGTFNNFKKIKFPDENIHKYGSKKYSNDYLLFLLHDFKRKRKINPKPEDMKVNPKYQTFYKRFGSWSRALALAGLK